MAALLFQWRVALRNAPELIASDRHVALEMSLYMDEHGQDAWPGADAIADGTALKKETVLSSLAWLLDAGWLVRSRRSRRERFRYAANVPTDHRKTRDDRATFMAERKAVLTENRRSKRATNSVGRNGRLTEQVEMGNRVGRNGESEQVETGDHVTLQYLSKGPLTNPSPTALAVDGEIPSAYHEADDETLWQIANHHGNELNRIYAIAALEARKSLA